MATATKRKPKKPAAKVATVTKRANKARPKRKPKGKTKMTTDKGKDDQPTPTTGHTAKDKERIEAEKRQFANRDQDPNHPANKTLSPDPNAPKTFSIPPGDMLTEQEKDAAGGGEGAGVGPVSPSEHTTGPVETIEDQGIGPRTPYPEGNPPPDDEVITRSTGINKGDQARATVKPGETTRERR
jgi:hypothetical protein